MFIFIILFVVAVALIVPNIRIVPQSNAYVIERLGGYLTTWKVGLNLKIPLIDRISSKVSLKEKVVDFPPQPVITKDNVTMSIDTVVYYQIVNPKLFTYGVDNPISAIENLTATSLRNIIGNLELDESLTSRDTINTQMRATLDEATDPWGIKVNRVEVKNIEPPADIQEAMEKQMRAERERRESILRAEGEKRSAILEAEGQKESAIRKAEGRKAARVLEAQAISESAILEAEGQAKATILAANAEAKALTAIQNTKPNDALLALKKVEALGKLGEGRATKIVLPTELAGLGSLLTTASELLKDEKVLDEDLEEVSLDEETLQSMEDHKKKVNDKLEENREDVDLSEIESEIK